jgi:hypothetical protein
MDAARIARAGLTGVRGKAAVRASGFVARHTPIRRDWLLTAIGAIFVLAAIRTLLAAAGAFSREARRA